MRPATQRRYCTGAEYHNINMSFSSYTTHPSFEHEERVEILTDLAIMMGFSVPIITLPDKSRPDVCRFHSATRGIFIGEAKASERPTCASTRLRFTNYIRWLMASRAQVSASVCSICFSDISDAPQWTEFLKDALAHFRMLPIHITVSPLEYPVGLLCAGLAPTP
jgi:hypothetical protein